MPHRVSFAPPRSSGTADSSPTMPAESNSKTSALDDIREQQKTLLLTITNLQSQVAQKEQEVSECRRHLNEAKEMKTQFNALLEMHDQTTWFLLSVLEDSKDQLYCATVTLMSKTSSYCELDAEEEDAPRLDGLSKSQREKVLRYFLTKLRPYQLAAQGETVEDTHFRCSYFFFFTCLIP